MSIEEAGHARFRAHEKALEDHLALSMKPEQQDCALVRHVFRVVAAPTLSDGTTTERWMARPVGFDSIVAEGSKHIDEVLRGEDRALIDALAATSFEERSLAHSWSRAVHGERPAGGVATVQLNRVLLAFRTLSNTALVSMRENGVKVVYPHSEIRTYALNHPTKPAVGYVLDPNPDGVVLRVKSDWRVMRSTSAASVQLVLESTSKIEIGDRTTAVRIVR